MRTTNNIIFSSLDSWESTLQQAKDNSKHLFDLNSKAAKTFEQNAREVRAAAQHTSSRFNASINNNLNSGSNTNITTTGTSTTTTTSTTSSA